MFTGLTIQFLLILFPLAGYVCLLGYLYSSSESSPENNGPQNMLRAAVLYGVYQVLTIEVLSLFKAVTAVGLVLAWSLLIAAFGVWTFRRRPAKLHFPKITLPKDWPSWLMFTIIVFTLVITFTVAWFTPPQTWDSLTYHASRIAHWAQNQSVGHYITGIERQNSMSPGAEMISLGFYVLINGDRLACMTQWLAMFFSLIAAAVVARHLGVPPFGQWLAAVITATITIGIVEASSTITDYVAALWVICVAAELLAYWRSDWHKKGNQTRPLVFISLAAGLGFLTKPIVLPYMVVFAIVLGILLIRRTGVLGTIKWAGVAVTLVLLINAGYITRNLRTYSSFSNPVDFQNHMNQLLTPAGVISNVVKSFGLHAGLPFNSYNKWLDLQVLKIHVKLGIDIQDPRTTGDGVFAIRPPVTQEDLTSNPYQAYLMVLTVPLILLSFRRMGKIGVLYTLLTAAAFIIYCGLFKWHIFNSRYHLVFFVLFAPALALFWGQVQPRPVGAAVGVALVILAWPWLFSIDSRPLIPTSSSKISSSILSVSRERLAFANLGPDSSQDFTEIVQRIQANSCNSVGMMLWGDDPEYLFWKLLGAPRNNLRIEWIVSGAPSDRYRPTDFQPCAVICRDCTQSQNIRGNLFAGQYGDLQLFLLP